MGEAEEQEPRSLAHYLWPPQWVGQAPAWAEPVPAWVTPDPSCLGDLMVEAALPTGAQARVFRDGMIASVLGAAAPSYEEDFQQWLGTGLRVMNAHLACLHAALEPFLFRSAVVTPWTTMQVRFKSGDLLGMTDASSGGTLIALYKARTATVMQADDWRFQRRSPVVVEMLRCSNRSICLASCLIAQRRSEIGDCFGPSCCYEPR